MLSNMRPVNPATGRANSNKNQYQLTGTAKCYRKISRLSTIIPRTTTTLRLNYVEIGPDFLAVLSKCPALEKIYLLNVKLMQAFTFNQRILLPNLKKFSMHIVDKIVGSISWNNYVNSLNLKTLLFFDKRKNDDWTLDDLYSLDINITLRVNNVTLVNINQDEDELILNKVRRIGFKPNDDKISNIYRLSVAHSGISNVKNLPYQFLGHLVFFNVTVNQSELFAYLSRCKSLTDLSIWNGHISVNIDADCAGEDITLLDISRHLTSPRLRRVNLYNCAVTCSPPPLGKNFIPLETCRELCLYSCEWDDLFVKHITAMCPNLGKVCLSVCRNSGGQLLSRIIDSDSGISSEDNVGNKEGRHLYFVYLRKGEHWDEMGSETVTKLEEYFNVEGLMKHDSILLQRSEFSPKKSWTKKTGIHKDEKDKQNFIYTQFQLSKFWNAFETYSEY